MSKIIRSLAESSPRVDSANCFDKPLASAHRGRPAGGIAGLGEQVEPRKRLMSVIEKREEQAQECLDAARRTLEEAERRAEQIQRDAYTAGFEQGDKAGQKLSAQKAEPLLQVFEQLIDALQLERARLAELHEGDLIKIAFSIAAQIVKSKVETEPETATRNVEAALEKVGDRTAITLKISPLDHQLVRQYVERREGAMWDEAHLKIETDETIGRGGCRVETPTGDIDATIDTQLRVFKSLLWNE